MLIPASPFSPLPSRISIVAAVLIIILFIMVRRHFRIPSCAEWLACQEGVLICIKELNERGGTGDSIYLEEASCSMLTGALRRPHHLPCCRSLFLSCL